MGDTRRRETHEIAGPDLVRLPVDIGDGAAGEDIDPFLLVAMGVIGEGILPRRYATQRDMGARQPGETRAPGAPQMRVGVEALAEDALLCAELLGFPQEFSGFIGHGALLSR